MGNSLSGFDPLILCAITDHQLLHDTKRRSVNSSYIASDNATEYDYVVVGSGPGGGPLAARLAIVGYRVLLIDAGDNQGNATKQQVPTLQLQSTEYKPIRWDYFVNHYSNLTRQEEDSKITYRAPSRGLRVGPDPPANLEPLGILYPRAGTLGGCSAHNAMIMILAYDSDWDSIASATGDDSWSAEKMREYLKRLERNRYLRNSIAGHGFNGWLTTSLTQLKLVLEDQKLLSLVIAAATAAGQNLLGKIVDTVTGLGDILLRDLNNDGATRDQQVGLCQMPLAVDIPGYRRTGPRDFLMGTVNAVNADGSRKYHLDIQLNTLVTNGNGVDYIRGQSLYKADPRSENASVGTPGYVNAAREVVLSTGTFNTPQLLKLSGIGPKDELNRWNISVLVGLPGVGTNLQDCYETGLWQKNSLDKGTYTTNGIAIAIIRKSSASDGEPDLLISGAPANFQGYFPGYSYEALKDAQHWTWLTLKSHSHNNAGTVELRSTDPKDTPIINFNSFDTGVTENDADDKDLQAVYEAMEFSRKIFDNLVPLDGSFEEVWPGPNVTTEAELKEFIKREAWGHHACCTNLIGPDTDNNSVLDSRFRVLGVDGLRVVDASVFPKIPGYYIALPIYMVSEKAADSILSDAT
ncbi:hypothetical protein BDV33DRAFT_194598 [Aspergillus novoparasiticus]|uniref:Glucose-methanol-choline oxidoreductase N-terminal domain-containing protein n=1 Tax=Aspergillus novoparasiticus TaxID=986946 RepID=A0A5N6EFD2_9EURO|nr:hypothetical protein BDV33DRAFT_194598 [Aspergillus novoparasiticus]